MFRSYDHPQGAYFVPLLKLQFKTFSDSLRYINLVLWQPCCVLFVNRILFRMSLAIDVPCAVWRETNEVS